MNNISVEENRKRKAEIRKEIIGLLRSQTPLSREERSRAICEKLLSSDEFRQSRTVMTYVSLPTEVDTFTFNAEALKRGKRVAVPLIDVADQVILASELTSMENLVKGPFGIYEPKDGQKRTIPLKEIDLIVVPAIAFDRNNMRLGRGKGYYDRFLAGRDLSSAKTIGIAFRSQIVDSLPSDPHDRPVMRVVTD